MNNTIYTVECGCIYEGTTLFLATHDEKKAWEKLYQLIEMMGPFNEKDGEQMTWVDEKTDCKHHQQIYGHQVFALSKWCD